MLEDAIEPRSLAPRRDSVADGQRAIQNGEAGVAAFKLIDQPRFDLGRSISRQVEKRTVETRAHVEILMIAGAGHERQAIEYSSAT